MVGSSAIMAARRARADAAVLVGGRFTRVDRSELGPAALVRRRYRYRSVRWASELWIRKGTRWILLADTPQTTHPQPTPTLDALAVQLSRALDVPLRTASKI